MPVARRFVISGRVQGVGFRWFVRVQARRLGLAGWVANAPDGSVEIAASGEQARLDDLRRAHPRLVICSSEAFEMPRPRSSISITSISASRRTWMRAVSLPACRWMLVSDS